MNTEEKNAFVREVFTGEFLKEYFDDKYIEDDFYISQDLQDYVFGITNKIPKYPELNWFDYILQKLLTKLSLKNPCVVRIFNVLIHTNSLTKICRFLEKGKVGDEMRYRSELVLSRLITVYYQEDKDDIFEFLTTLMTITSQFGSAIGHYIYQHKTADEIINWLTPYSLGTNSGLGYLNTDIFSTLYALDRDKFKKFVLPKLKAAKEKELPLHLFSPESIESLENTPFPVDSKLSDSPKIDSPMDKIVKENAINKAFQKKPREEDGYSKEEIDEFFRTKDQCRDYILGKTGPDNIKIPKISDFSFWSTVLRKMGRKLDLNDQYMIGIYNLFFHSKDAEETVKLYDFLFDQTHTAYESAQKEQVLKGFISILYPEFKDDFEICSRIMNIDNEYGEVVAKYLYENHKPEKIMKWLEPSALTHQNQDFLKSLYVLDPAAFEKLLVNKLTSPHELAYPLPTFLPIIHDEKILIQLITHDLTDELKGKIRKGVETMLSEKGARFVQLSLSNSYSCYTYKLTEIMQWLLRSHEQLKNPFFMRLRDLAFAIDPKDTFKLYLKQGVTLETIFKSYKIPPALYIHYLFEEAMGGGKKDEVDKYTKGAPKKWSRVTPYFKKDPEAFFEALKTVSQRIQIPAIQHFYHMDPAEFNKLFAELAQERTTKKLKNIIVDFLCRDQKNNRELVEKLAKGRLKSTRAIGEQILSVWE